MAKISKSRVGDKVPEGSGVSRNLECIGITFATAISAIKKCIPQLTFNVTDNICSYDKTNEEFFPLKKDSVDISCFYVLNVQSTVMILPTLCGTTR